MIARRLDAIDLRLLEALQEDARASNRSLAKRVNLSESACLARLRNLERDGVIVGYDVHLSYEQLGAFETWVDVTLVDDEDQTVAAFERLISKEHEIRAAYLIGEDTKFRLHVVTANFEGWRAFSSRLLSHRSIIKGLTRSLIYKSYRAQGSAARTLLSSRDDKSGA